MQLWIEPKLKGDFTPIKRDLDLLIREPRDYITTQAHFDAPTRKLSFKLSLDGNGEADRPEALSGGPGARF